MEKTNKNQGFAIWSILANRGHVKTTNNGVLVDLKTNI